MREISRFLGIAIRMYYRDHAPPHFHAEYGEHEMTVDIETAETNGEFPRRAFTAVIDWHAIHRDELRTNWHLARQEQPLNRIEPLE